MKNFTQSYLFLLVIVGIGIAAMSFNTVDRGSESEKTFVDTGLFNFKNHLERLKSDVYLYKEGEITVEELQTSLRNTRNSYKEIEFYIAYHYPEFSKTHLNAAPLFRIEAAGTSAYTLPPEGLQVLDELIFSEDASDQKDKIITITDILYNNYNNFYLNGYISKTVKEGSNYKITVDPGVKAVSYPQLDRRLDLTAYVASDITWQTRSSTEINPYGEIGFVFSNKGYYSRRYFALGVIWSEKLRDNYSFSLDYYMRNTIYPNRTVSDILFSPNRSGRATGKAFDLHESIALRQLSASLTKSFLQYELTGGLIYSAESSLSDLEKYSESQVYISALFEL